MDVRINESIPLTLVRLTFQQLKKCKRNYKIFLKWIHQMNFLAKVMKKNVRPFKVWLGPLLFIKVLLRTAQLFSKHFYSSLSLCILYFLFHKSKDTSAIPQPNVQHLVYVFLIFFAFINALITST